MLMSLVTTLTCCLSLPGSPSQAPESYRPVAGNVPARSADSAPQTAADNKERKLLILVAPGVTCHGRFQDSLREHFVKKYDWVHGVTIATEWQGSRENLARLIQWQPPKEIPSSLESFPLGLPTMVTFSIDAERDEKELMRLIDKSGLYFSKHWVQLKIVSLREAIGTADPK